MCDEDGIKMPSISRAGSYTIHRNPNYYKEWDISEIDGIKVALQNPYFIEDARAKALNVVKSLSTQLKKAGYKYIAFMSLATWCYDFPHAKAIRVYTSTVMIGFKRKPKKIPF